MTLEERIQRLEDIEAIRMLKHRYLNACDTKQVKRVRDCFAEGEILIDYGPVGVFKDRDQFAELFRVMACHNHVVDLHHGSNPEIKIEGDTALARWALFYFNIDARSGATKQLGGIYEDEYQRIEGEWKIVRTTFKAHSVHNTEKSE
ncbi:nuclear transport factor 2 family protein [Endozoicomonas arenosclerae]|uniref:nuclear transport factor 2 family protein n=1 Tax=Endozoicomonas arenosclerae TaxID=1633495 RepID=UPI0007845E6A|nr:nuclear transport factor 2 family protein [Endozoicomonas arenosclerae]